MAITQEKTVKDKEHWKTRLTKEIARLEAVDQTAAVRAKLSKLRRQARPNPKGKNGLKETTHCKHGHKYTKENTGRSALGAKVCRQCRRDRYSRKHKKAT